MDEVWGRPMSLIFCEGNTDDEATTKDTQGDKGRYENNVQLVQWISSVSISLLMIDTVTPKTLSILTPNVVWEVHHLIAWELHLALVELYIVHTLGYKIAP